MPFPLVLCTGILGSGSTWSFNVCRLMAKVVAGRENKPMWSGYLLAEQTEGFLRTYVNDRPGPTVVKAHKLTDFGLYLLRSGAAKAVCTYRDPRDCVASMMTFAGQPFEIAMGSIAEALHSLDAYAAAGHTMFIRYEDMLDDRLAQIQRIGAYLDVALDAELLKRIDDQTSLEYARLACKKMRNQPGKNYLQSMDHQVDPGNLAARQSHPERKIRAMERRDEPAAGKDVDRSVSAMASPARIRRRQLEISAERRCAPRRRFIDQSNVHSGSSAELK